MHKEIRVFLASPGDIRGERDIFYTLLPQIGAPLGVRFVPTGYEVVPAAVGPRSQDLINREVDASDIFVAVFHRRWGQDATDSVAATSYTEEEFARALRRFSDTGAPAIFCFFKNIDLDALADPGPQLTKVLEFKRRLETSGQVLYRTFSFELEFEQELARHLQYFVQNGMPKPRKEKVLLPVLADAGHDVNYDHDIAIVRQAAAAAAVGRLEEAETLFARISQTTIVVTALDVAKAFFDAVGNTDASRAVMDRKLALLRDRRIAAQEYVAAMTAPGWLDNMIAARLSITPHHQRHEMEVLLRKAFGGRFQEIMLDLMSENFTLGELRTLTKFFTGEAATVSNKMADFMGRVLPPAVEQLLREAGIPIGG